MGHVVRISHHDTGAIETYCGITETLPQRTESVTCMDCIIKAIESDRQHLQDELVRMAEYVNEKVMQGMQRPMSWVDNITLRLERLEIESDKQRRKAKRKKGKKK